MHRTLVSTDVLAEHLSDATWAVIDCRYDLGTESWGVEQYRASHIPGAVYASLSHDLAGPRSGTNGRHPLPTSESMTATFGRWGMTPATQVVVYDQDAGMYAARLWWMLRYMGHDAVAVLDGGFAQWTRENKPTRSGDEHRVAVRFSGTPRDAMRQTVEQIEQQRYSRILVDARAPERYEGRNEPLDRVPGHIPGARNYFFKRNLSSEGTLLPPEQLRTQLSSALGGASADQATMYCGSGVTACHNLLALEHAGMPGAKLYVGSWSEWSSDPSRPVATGPEETERRDAESQRK